MKISPLNLVLTGLLLFSIGINFIFYSRIVLLQEYLMESNPWVNVEQVDLIKKEIDRLENTKYQIVSPKDTN